MSKVSVVTDIRVVIDPPDVPWFARKTPEQHEKYLRDWCKEFEAFVRDHRSQDPVYLSVIADKEDQCSHCYRAWEEDEDGPLCCDKAQQEHAAAKEKVTP